MMVPDLSPGTLYSFTVQAFNPQGVSRPSVPPLTVTTLGTHQPTPFAATLSIITYCIASHTKLYVIQEWRRVPVAAAAVAVVRVAIVVDQECHVSSCSS